LAEESTSFHFRAAGSGLPALPAVIDALRKERSAAKPQPKGIQRQDAKTQGRKDSAHKLQRPLFFLCGFAPLRLCVEIILKTAIEATAKNAKNAEKESYVMAAILIYSLE
jgi:hypothetical protein